MPRIMPYIHAKNMRGQYSLDILNGFDLLHDDKFSNTFKVMHATRPHLTFISPPCTVFSKLQESLPEFGSKTSHLIRNRKLCLTWLFLGRRSGHRDTHLGVMTCVAAVCVRLLNLCGQLAIRARTAESMPNNR